MRRTIKEADVNMAYRWFLGLGIYEPVPHFSTSRKNYTRRFKGSDLFEQIFQRILSECFEAGMVEPSVVYVDSTHVKARANGKNIMMRSRENRRFGMKKSRGGNADRESHGKRPLKNLTGVNNDDNAKRKR